jgi:hypothetical protein
MKPTTLISVLVLAAGAIAAVAIVLTFGAAPLEVAKIVAPPQLALKTAQLGLLAPAAQAAPIASEAGYLPARFTVPAVAEEPLPPQF